MRHQNIISKYIPCVTKSKIISFRIVHEPSVYIYFFLYDREIVLIYMLSVDKVFFSIFQFIFVRICHSRALSRFIINLKIFVLRSILSFIIFVE